MNICISHHQSSLSALRELMKWPRVEASAGDVGLVPELSLLPSATSPTFAGQPYDIVIKPLPNHQHSSRWVPSDLQQHMARCCPKIFRAGAHRPSNHTPQSAPNTRLSKLLGIDVTALQTRLHIISGARWTHHPAARLHF